MKPDRREVAGLACKSCNPSIWSKAFKSFYANSIEEYGGEPMGWSPTIQCLHWLGWKVSQKGEICSFPPRANESNITAFCIIVSDRHDRAKGVRQWETHNWCEEVSINYLHLGSLRVKDMMKKIPLANSSSHFYFLGRSTVSVLFSTLRTLNNVIWKLNTSLGFFRDPSPQYLSHIYRGGRSLSPITDRYFSI